MKRTMSFGEGTPLSDRHMRGEIITLTPALAAEFLGHANPLNRGTQKAVVETYASDMAAGTWVLIPQGLVFGPDGKLLDGHHRCHAVVQSGVSVPMVRFRFHTEQAARAALHAIDRGKGRRTGHILELLGHIPPGTGLKVDAVVRALQILESNNPSAMSANAVLAGYLRTKTSIDWVLGVMVAREYAIPVWAAIAYAHRAFPAEAAEFARLIVEKVGLVAGSATHRFVQTAARLRRDREPGRRGAMGGVGGSSARRDTMLLTLRAIVGHIRGERLAKLYAVEEGKSYIDAAMAKLAKKVA